MAETTQQSVLEQSRALARRLYDLDTKVYHSLGTLISRSYTGEEMQTIENLALLILSDNSHKLRSELALVANMARTIPDKQVRARLISEYDDILESVMRLPRTIAAYDIKDESLAELNEALGHRRISEHDHLIICISRSAGCAGTDIGFALADTLKIGFYDSEIFDMVLDRLEADDGAPEDPLAAVSAREAREARPRRSLKQVINDLYRYHGLPRQHAVFFNQSDLLCELAKKEDFVVMGRCAHQILTYHRIPHISIFIDAPLDLRVRRTMAKHGLDRKRAIRMIRDRDRRRRKYYNFFTGRKWGFAANYDLCINSGCYGIGGSVEMICRMINKQLPERFHELARQRREMVEEQKKEQEAEEKMKAAEEQKAAAEPNERETNEPN